MSRSPRITPEQLDALQGKANPKGPLVVLRGGGWHWTRKPSDEDQVERACLTIADWHRWGALADLAPRGRQVLSAEEHKRAVRIAIEEVRARGLVGLYYRTSTKARSRNSLGTPDYHFARIDGGVTGVEFKGPGTPLRVNQAILAEIGASIIIGPDDLDKFAEML